MLSSQNRRHISVPKTPAVPSCASLHAVDLPVLRMFKRFPVLLPPSPEGQSRTPHRGSVDLTVHTLKFPAQGWRSSSVRGTALDLEQPLRRHSTQTPAELTPIQRGQRMSWSYPTSKERRSYPPANLKKLRTKDRIGARGQLNNTGGQFDCAMFIDNTKRIEISESLSGAERPATADSDELPSKAAMEMPDQLSDWQYDECCSQLDKCGSMPEGSLNTPATPTESTLGSPSEPLSEGVWGSEEFLHFAPPLSPTSDTCQQLKQEATAPESPGATPWPHSLS